MTVRLERDGWILIASDAIYLADTYGKRFVPSILNQFPEEWARSAVKVRRLVERYGMTVLPGHDDRVIVPSGDGGHRVEPIRSVYR